MGASLVEPNLPSFKQTITTSTSSLTIPPGVSRVFAVLYGGGGGGGGGGGSYTNSYLGGGGGSGGAGGLTFGVALPSTTAVVGAGGNAGGGGQGGGNNYGGGPGNAGGRTTYGGLTVTGGDGGNGGAGGGGHQGTNYTVRAGGGYVYYDGSTPLNFFPDFSLGSYAQAGNGGPRGNASQPGGSGTAGQQGVIYLYY